MAVKTQSDKARLTFLLARAPDRQETFSSLHPEIVRTSEELIVSLANAKRNSIWISYEQDLTQELLQSSSRPLGVALLVHTMSLQTLPTLAACFKRFAIARNGESLPPLELAEALNSEKCFDLFIAGNVDHQSQKITLWRGNLESLTIPFSAFEASGDGTIPDFERFSVTDSGQTVKLGDYEAATDAILYEFDPDYRRKMVKRRQESEQSLGASIRRLRKQRGLRREDFGPALAGKTIARIEQGTVEPHRKTLIAIADRLGVTVAELGQY